MSGWWLARLRELGDAVDERDRGGEVGELELAHDRGALARCQSRERGQALLDLVRLLSVAIARA